MISNLLKKTISYTFAVISLIYALIPESLLKEFKLLDDENCCIILNRILIFIIAFIIIMITGFIYYKFRRKVYIKGHNYKICIKYGNIFKQKKCKVVIPFDECLTTNVGNLPSDINPNSICGQYLKKYPNLNIKELTKKSNLLPAKNKSKYKNKNCYTSGKLIINNEFLLMAFAKLDENGLGYFSSVEDFTNCLSILWEEIDKYYGQKNVCIPILGSGVTRFGDTKLTKQELLDIIICSYKLNRHKIKNPCKLYIVCKRSNDFSLNNIGKSI